MKTTREKKCLMVHDYIGDKVSERIKEIINTETFDDTKILIDINNKFINDKFPDDITCINAVALLRVL